MLKRYFVTCYVTHAQLYIKLSFETFYTCNSSLVSDRKEKSYRVVTVIVRIVIVED